MRAQPFVTVLLGPDQLVREGLMRILRPAGFRIVASLADMDNNVFISLPRDQPLLFIIDSGGDSHATVRQIRRIKQEFSTGCVAILAAQNHQVDVVSAFKAGASCLLTKAMPSDVLIKSFELVMLGETILPSTILSRFAEDQPCVGAPPRVGAVDAAAGSASALSDDGDGTPRLSAREIGILKCLVQGDSNKAIARRISIAEATVKVHVKAILRKIRVHNRTQAAIWALHRGLLIAPEQPAAMQIAVELQNADSQLSQALVMQSGMADPIGPSLGNGADHRRRY